MIAHIEGTKVSSHLYCIRQEQLSDYFFFLYQARTCICTGTWVTPSNICVTKVNMRNIFYNKISEYSHCPQEVKVTFDFLYISVVGSWR